MITLCYKSSEGEVYALTSNHIREFWEKKLEHDLTYPLIYWNLITNYQNEEFHKLFNYEKI